MRELDDDGPKQAQPVRVPSKGASAAEIAEDSPCRPARKDLDRHRRRHV
jgi:hypothetical protein